MKMRAQNINIPTFEEILQKNLKLEEKGPVYTRKKVDRSTQKNTIPSRHYTYCDKNGNVAIARKQTTPS